jgi:hypothetical protein
MLFSKLGKPSGYRRARRAGPRRPDRGPLGVRQLDDWQLFSDGTASGTVLVSLDRNGEGHAG